MEDQAQQIITMILAGSVISPFIAAVINRAEWPRWVRQLVAVVIAVAVAIVAILATGGFSGDWVQDMLIVVPLATFAYEAVWKPTGIAAAVEATIFPGKVSSNSTEQ